ncbi:hypothetical protein N8482_01255 [Chitinophagales bacterium]|nr:hypothetical protein [Chitinophagales bacterium]
MKKIGILFGKESTFPFALIDRINQKNVDGIVAEKVQVDVVRQAEPTGYSVIIDRISQDVPFYRAYLKNAALTGTSVINNPFWWSADEKFFNSALAETIGVPVPKTVILPSHHRPDDTSEESFRNLVFPTNWKEIFDYIGFPAYMKPHDGGGWKSVYRVENPADLFEKHAETNQLVMMLQEEILFDSYFRCYCLGQKDVLVMPYEPRNPHHLRYVVENPTTDKKLLAKIEALTIKLNKALGYDFNTVEFAVRDGIPYAIDFCNPAPDADLYSVGQENFDWIVEAAANMAIEKAQANKEGDFNMTWGSFLETQIAGEKAKTTRKATKASTKKTAPKATAKVTAKATKVVADKLTKIEGIGPKIAGLLVADGIDTFAKLGKASQKKLNAILAEAGPRFQMHKPTTWPTQAKLAAKGNWDELKTLQDELDGGKAKS